MTSSNLLENKIVIADTSCFVLLQKIDALPILHQLYATVLITPEIAIEYADPLPDWVTVQSANQSLIEKFRQHVDRGEASAIALASEVSCDFIIVDDLAARKLAVMLGLPIKGTVGVLLSAKQNGVIPLFRPYLDLIQQTNFRLSQQLAEQFIKDAGE
jgi:predicted nucleic acid-binding protein